MKIDLDLRHHCIATEVKKIYSRAISHYFKPDADIEQLEKKIEILKKLLETSDFAHLRNTYPELRGHSDSKIDIKALDNGEVFILLNGKRIDIPSIKKRG